MNLFARKSNPLLKSNFAKLFIPTSLKINLKIRNCQRFSSTNETKNQQKEDKKQSNKKIEKSKKSEKSENFEKIAHERKKEIAKLKDQILRFAAELENTRKISQKEINKARNFSISKFALSLLNAHDNLQRALDVAHKNISEAKKHQNELGKAFVNLFDGIKMTEDALDKTFGDFGIKKIECEGAKIDPKFHDVLTTVKNAGKEDMTVAEVLQEGFTINERTLRAAQVVANKN
ncbi:hypothetical protein MHBO_004457 [Bonamia ostreae]|uniref:GrpE protein homolog n=1 Tax=Bonamia ostreae TaxID=126728 RepID=A0ABV2AU56_9EUKA